VFKIGLFIVFEGPDGSGKSTAAQGVYEYYLDRNESIIHTREPGGTQIGEGIRDLLLDPEHKKMNPRAEALLYAASRAQHVEETIRPELEAGGIVLCERYVFSSLVYQGMVRGLGIKEVKAINDFATAGLKPDLTLYFDPGKTLGLHRIVDRPLDRLEQEGEEFNHSVQESYRKLAQNLSGELTIIDATDSIEEVKMACIKQIENIRGER